MDWKVVEADLGTALPADYKALADHYPGVLVDSFLAVFHPVPREGNFSLREFADQTLGYLRLRREDLPHHVPYALFPEPGGLLPWGVTDNNNFLFWLTAGQPDEWQVVVTDNEEWWTHRGSMRSFLAGVLRKEIRCPVLPDDFPDDDYEVESA